MGQHAIIDKLQEELRLPLKRESQVLYLMAEIRKYLEHEKRKSFPLLQFFCNWALHIKIDKPHNAGNVAIFLKAFDFKSGMSLKDYLASNFFKEIIHLSILRTELKRFLANYHLPTTVTEAHQQWSAFLYLYTSIVAEVPLEYSKGDSLPHGVTKLEITRFGPLPSMEQKMTRWAVTIKGAKRPFAVSTAYGEKRNENNDIIALPDFWEEGFQL
jgi:hypothetical protein